jgi:uncharacterized membrane protein HdeD (DUF308 family)
MPAARMVALNGKAVTTANASTNYLRHEVLEAIRSHWVLFLIQDLVMAVLGLMAASEPMFSTFAVVILQAGFSPLASA